jgi:uncharacterized protein (DUF58 family)
MRTTRIAAMLVTAILGAGAAFGVAACGEDREGEVEVEGGTTGTAGGTSTTPTAGTAPTTEEAPTTESGGGATAP